MAKYTELFMEYLEDEEHTLPSSFNLIEGFDELFKMYYCDKEIGFETEELFALKLELYANLLMPRYAEQISKIAEAWGFLNGPARTHYESTTTILGEQKASQTELPIDYDTAQPSMVSQSEETTNTYEANHEDVSLADKIAYYNRLNEKVDNILIQLLKAFGPCFMEIY